LLAFAKDNIGQWPNLKLVIGAICMVLSRKVTYYATKNQCYSMHHSIHQQKWSNEMCTQNPVNNIRLGHKKEYERLSESESEREREREREREPFWLKSSTRGNPHPSGGWLESPVVAASGPNRELS
jgi:hypothetical protein